MTEKKKAVIVLVFLLVLLIIIVSVILASLIESNKKLEEIKDVLNSKEPRIVYLAKDSCYYCNLIKPITTELEEEFDLDYYYIDTENLSSIELSNILKTLGINLETFGTPYLAIVQNGKIIDEQVGYTDEDVLFELFKKNGIISENESLHMEYIDNLDEVWNNSTSSLVFIGQSGDENSIENRLTLRELSKIHGFNIKYFDTAKLTDEDKYSNLLDKLGIGELPILVKIENGNIISKETGMTKENYETYLKENGYIK